MFSFLKRKRLRGRTRTIQSGVHMAHVVILQSDYAGLNLNTKAVPKKDQKSSSDKKKIKKKIETSAQKKLETKLNRNFCTIKETAKP